MAASFSTVLSSPAPWISSRSEGASSCRPSASLSLSTGYRSRSNFSMNVTTSSTSRSGLLHCSFLSSSSLSIPASFSDTKFTQQELLACKPILTPGWVISAFLLVSVVFIPIGIVSLFASQDG